jgi:hypothetical protein
VGGFSPVDLWNLLARVSLLPDTPLLVGTACKCHGVIDAFCHGRAKTLPDQMLPEVTWKIAG